MSRPYCIDLDPSRPSRDRMPPHSDEAERGVLGCILTSPILCLPEVVARIGASGAAFYDLRHGVLYSLCVALADELKPIDLFTVQTGLKAQNQLEAVGGIAYLSQLQDDVVSAANLSAYLDILEEKWLLRKLVQVCTEIVSRAMTEADTGTIIDDAERNVLAIRKLKSRAGAEGIKELVGKAMDEIERLYGRQGSIGGLSTGLTDLDRMTDGLHPEEVTVVCAYPGNGKTSLAVNVAEHAAIDLQAAVGIFSLEMSSVQLVMRMLASRARVNMRNVKDGYLSERDFPQLAAAAVTIATSRIFLDDVSALSIHQLRASARRMAQQHGVQLIVIDYLQLVSSSGNRREQNREQEVSEISKGVKAMAKELRIPVLLLSQLNDDGRLRESRAIGQDADNIWFIEPDKGEKEDSSDRFTRPMLLRIRKQRNGPTGTIPLTFLKTFTRFENAAKVTGADVPDQPKLPYSD